MFGILGSLEERADRLYRRGRLNKAAALFRKAGRHGQAASIHVEAGNVDAAVEVLREAGLERQAGEVLSRHGRVRDAVALFEEGRAFRQAGDACLTLKQYVRAAGFFSRAHLFQAAAEAYVKAGELEKALAAWERESERLRGESDLSAGHHDRLRDLDMQRVDMLARLGRDAEAAAILIGLDRHGRAAPLLERAGRPADAARAYLEAGMPERALPLLEEEEVAERLDDDLRLEIYLRNARHLEAARLLESLGRTDEAAGAYEDAMEWGRAARLWEQADLPARAAELYFRVERYAEAGTCFAASNQHEKAGQSFARAGNDRAAADAYIAADELVRAAEHYLAAGDRAAARDALQGVDTGNPGYVRASFMLIPLLLDEGLVEGARHRLGALEANAARGRLSGAARNYWHGRIAEAEGKLDEAERAYQRVVAERSDFRDSGQRLTAVRERLSSTDTAELTASRAQPAALLDTAPGPEVDTSPVIAVPETGDDLLAGLPFDLEEGLAPWWPTSQLYRAKGRRGREALLLAFPLGAGAGQERFRSLSGQARRLTHPSILAQKEAIIAGDRAVLRFEPFGGGPMSRRLRGPWRPTASAALNILVQVGEALASAHKLGLVHGWLSPNTILLDDDERIKLVGFGLDALFPADDGTAVAYRAPEIESGVPPGPTADLFSFGLLGVELLGALLPVDWTSRPIDPAAVEWGDDVAEIVPETVRANLVACLVSDPLARPSAERMRAVLSSLGLVPGQMIQGRYEIEGEIGRGGMSRVYRAYDRTVAETVAIKTLHSPMLRHPDEEQRLLREVQICRRITHPNVVRVHDLGNFPGGIFITMELLDGDRLDQVIRNRAPLALDEVRAILRQIAAALGEAHRMEVVHRDLKPGNVILLGDRVKVLDFGIARMGEGGTSLTRTGEVYGSPLYMAPEQIRGKPLDGRCDFYALGVIAFALLTGREPFIGDNPEAVIYQHLHDAPPDPRSLRPSLPQAWCDLLERLLDKKPAGRYGNVADLLAAFDPLPVSDQEAEAPDAAAAASEESEESEEAELEEPAAEAPASDEPVVDTAAVTDGLSEDGSTEDTGPEDTGPEDTGPEDTGPEDTGPEDTGPEDGSTEDTGPEDTGPEDGSTDETGPEDTGPEDTGPEDTGPEDTGPEDGSTDETAVETSPEDQPTRAEADA